MTQNKVSAIDHLVINVSNMEGAIAFYKRLGLQVVDEDRWLRGEVRRVSVQVGPSQKINVHGPQTNADLCLVWDGTVEEAEAYLQACGVEIVSRRATAGARGPARSVYFRDPDGNLWELMSYTPS